MAASSVTGVGQGSAEGQNKGTERMTLSIDKLIGSHIVAAGRATLSSGAATVTFPKPLSGSNTGYKIFVQSTASYARSDSATDASGNFVSFTLAGTGTDVVQWYVIKV